MADHALHPKSAATPIPSGLRETARTVTGYWWVQLISGVAWLAISLVILQFDDASVTTVGVLIGFMFLLAGIDNVTLATLTDRLRWVWAVFAVLMLVAAVICFVNPEETFAGLATSSASCSCSSACGGWCDPSWSGRSTRSGGSG